MSRKPSQIRTQFHVYFHERKGNNFMIANTRYPADLLSEHINSTRKGPQATTDEWATWEIYFNENPTFTATATARKNHIGLFTTTLPISTATSLSA
ncbi:hypothetical protein BELL_0584g00080 [Botrytis elliptica]|uniref:Uncharacterized protein n=1 Tax=Botrytis elliptica TaxID=278938 RepID=A0A4Z1JJB7_9HELO|nr:hypothetical protein BELL_0584g00080 [Botrytis elliptica]